MKTTRQLNPRHFLATLALTATLLSNSVSAASFPVEEVMAAYQQAETQALAEAARQVGFDVDPAGYRKSARGEAFAALLPVRGGAQATREQWARGRDVAVVALGLDRPRTSLPAGLYVLHVQIAKGRVLSTLRSIHDPGVQVSTTGTITSGTEGACEDPIVLGEDYVCINFCSCEIYLNQWACGSIGHCFKI